jgi:hypothetical protein
VDSHLSVVVIASGSDDALDSTVKATGETLKGRRFECFVVANGVSVDARRLAHLPFHSTLLQTETAVSPGALLNNTLERAHGDFVAFLWAGAVPQPYWHAGIAAAFENKDVAMVVARLLDAEGDTVRACGSGFNGGRLSFLHAGAPRDAIGVLRPTVLDLAPLCGSIVRREHIGVVGGYDVDFPQSLFDFDWTLRARVKGLAIVYRPDVTVCYDGPLAFGREASERPSAEHFLDRWHKVVQPNLEPAVFLP